MKKKGFALVELIIVLVILALLSAIIVSSMAGYLDRARENGLTVNCRSCVVAAQSLIMEEFGSTQNILAPDESDVEKLAEVNGDATNIVVNPSDASVESLVYTENGYSIKYERLPTPHYTFDMDSQPPVPSWESGTVYALGDAIVINGIHFECIRSHTSGNTKATRSPIAGTNKSTWQVTGFDDTADSSYSSMFRYDEGVVVTHAGTSYKRTNYNLTSSPTPYDGSMYWELVDN